MKISKRVTWSNKIKKYKVHPLKYLEPESYQDVVAAIREAEQTGARIRAVGSGHSYSDVAITDGYLVNMCRLCRLLPLKKEQLKAAWQTQPLVEVEAGITVEKLNKQLDKQGVALINMGAIDNQTISGAIATGTHGAGRHLPALSGLVRSMVLVAAGGKTYRIEPTDGITDPSQHNEEDITLIQDDDTFYSVVVSLGCTGIIYSYVLAVVPRYWLYENRSVDMWFKVKEKLANGKMFDDYFIKLNGKDVKLPVRSIFIVVNPFKVKGEHTCMITRTFEIDKPPRWRLKDGTRAILSSILSRVPLTFYLSLFVVNNIPRLVPRMLETSIKAVRDATYINKSYKVLFQGFEYIASQGHGSEFAYDRHQTTYLEVMEEIFDKVAQLAHQFKLYPSSAPTIRFVKGSPAYLTPEYQTDVCYIGNPVLVRQKGASLILNAYQDIHLARGGKPHWGKITNRLDGETELIRHWYPKFETWRQTMLQFNPAGTFLNGFAERMRLDEP